MYTLTCSGIPRMNGLFSFPQIPLQYISFFTICRSYASYTPNGSGILASTLNSTHRIIPINRTSENNNTTAATTSNNVASSNNSHVYCYTGHVNEKYTMNSTVYSNSFGDFVLSGSEDGKVRYACFFCHKSAPCRTYSIVLCTR